MVGSAAPGAHVGHPEETGLVGSPACPVLGWRPVRGAVHPPEAPLSFLQGGPGLWVVEAQRCRVGPRAL